MNHIIMDEKDIRASVYEWGKNTNPAILCLHGLGSTGLSFLEIAESIKSDYHIFSIELPGHGFFHLELHENFDYEIRSLCKWLHKVICKLQIASFFILSHSWGAQIAVQYADMYPFNIRGMILLDGGYHNKQLSYDYHKQKLFNCKQPFDFFSLEEEKKYYFNDFSHYIFDGWDQFLEFESKQYFRWNSLLSHASKDLMIEKDRKIVFRVKGENACKAIDGMYHCAMPKNLRYTLIPIVLVLALLPENLLEERRLQLYEFKKYVEILIVETPTTHMVHWDNPNFVVELIYKQFRC